MRSRLLDAALDPLAVYLSPSGRRCRLAADRSNDRQAVFLYDLLDGRPAPQAEWSEGFPLRRENWHLLRRVS